MKQCILLLGIGVWVIGAGSLPARGEPLSECLWRAGAKDLDAFIRFNAELRAAVKDDDPTALTLLSSYPLGVSRGDQRMSISTPGTLYAQAEEVFPDSVRAAVLATEMDELICTNGGIGYGAGDLWVEVTWVGDSEDHRDHFEIGTVHLGGDAIEKGPLFVCRTPAVRYAVDKDGEGSLRLRSWKSTTSLTGTPDLILLGGLTELSGSGVCAYLTFVFESATALYRLGEFGCLEASSPPPDGASGRLSVSIDGEVTSGYCY